MARAFQRTLGFGWLVGAVLGACTGGQTGDTGGQGDVARMCKKSGVEIELDQPLPAGYTARDLIEVFDGVSTPGYLFAGATAVDERALEPDDALAITEVTFEFEPADEESVALFEGTLCAVPGFTVYGTLTATTLDGDVVLSVEGGLSGPPEQATFWSGDLERSPGLALDPDLYGGFPSCNPDVPLLTARVSNGALMGNLCTSEGLVRFPTACGGFAQVALDEDVEGDLQVPSSALDRMQSAMLEVAWSEQERSPLELTIAPSEVACYEEVGYDDGNERPALTSTTAVDVTVTVEDVGIAFEQANVLTGSYGYLDDYREAVSSMRACSDLDSDSVTAINERLDATFRHVEACLSVIVREDERLEVALELSGASTVGRPDTDPPEPVELMERLVVLEVEP